MLKHISLTITLLPIGLLPVGFAYAQSQDALALSQFENREQNNKGEMGRIEQERNSNHKKKIKDRENQTGNSVCSCFFD